MADIQAECYRHKPGLVVVDYLQLLRAEYGPQAGSRDRELSLMTTRLKNLARDHGVAVLMLSQMNRQVEARENPIPQLSDLRESGGIENDSDVVLFCVRGRKPKSAGDGDDGSRLLVVGKNRHGRSGCVEVRFHFASMSVVEVD